MSSDLITVAVPKGRLLEEASLLFERAVGVSPKALLTGTRKLHADAARPALSSVEEDVFSALANLGCARPAAEAAVRDAQGAGGYDASGRKSPI